MANLLDDNSPINSETANNTNENGTTKDDEAETKEPPLIDKSALNSPSHQSKTPCDDVTSNGDVKNIKDPNHPSDNVDETGSYYGDYEQSVLPDSNYPSTFSVNEFCPDGFRNETAVDYLPVPPDGGYGWVVVAAAFMSNLIVDGISNSFGPFVAPYQETFHSTKAATSLIGSTLIGAYLLSGPIAGGLLNKYETQKVVIGGAILASISFALSTFSPNIFVHCIIYGLFGGIGFGFIYLPAIVIVSQYFEKKRALATGISVSGSGVGTFIMPLICKFFIEGFSWQITLYVLSVLILLCIVCGLFFKPIPFSEDQLNMNEEMKKQALFAALNRADLSEHGQLSDSYDYGTTTQAGGDLTPHRRENRTISQCTNHTDGRDDGQPLLNNTEPDENNDDQLQAITPPTRTQLSPISESKPLSKSRAGSQHHSNHATEDNVQNRLPAITRNRKTTLTSMNSEFTSIANGINFRQSRSNLNNQLSRISARSFAQSLSRISQGPQSIRAVDSVLSIALSGVDAKEFNRPLSRRDIFLQGSIRNLKEFEDEGCNYKSYREQHSISIPASVLAQSYTKLSNVNGGTVGNIAELSSRMGGSRYSRITGGFVTEEEEELAALTTEDTFFKWIPYPIRNAFSEMIDLNLLRERIMLLLCLSNILGMIGFYVPFVFVIDLAVEKNVPTSQGTLLLSAIGITNTVGRVFFGWIADKQWLSALMLNNLSLLLCGLLTCICPFAANFGWLLAYASLFGFIVSAYICLTSIVLSDLLGVERLTNSFGLIVVSRGIASLLGTPLAGIVYDATQSYNASFYFSGGLIVLSGLVSCLIPIVHRHERSKLQNEGDYHFTNKGDADIEIQSGKLSVLTERSEENLTEYQRTIQSITQQKQLIRELEEYKRKSKSNNNNGNNSISSTNGTMDGKQHKKSIED